MKKILVLLYLNMFCIVPIMAFYVDSINYAITSETTVEVTSPQDFVPSNLFIPEQITYEGKVYNVTSIGDSAFMWCYELTSITIPNGVTTIRDAAFSYCNALRTIEIPNSVISIGKRAFENSYLISIELPNSVISIGDSAFMWCPLTFIEIPNSVTTIGKCAFSHCNAFSISVDGGNNIYDSRDNCNAIIETATNALIVGTHNTVVPSSVTGIGDYAFCGCDSLQAIEIPNCVTSIGEGAFCGCRYLNSVYCMAEVPPTLEGVLSDRIIDNLFVPLGCARTYKQSPWVKEFKYIVEDGYDANVIDIDTTSATLCWSPQPNVTQYVINVYENENPYAEFIVNADGTIVSEKYADDISPTQSNQSFCGRKRKVSSESGIELPLMIITDTTTNSTDYFVITLNNLQPGTDYSYTVQGMNVMGESIYEDTGTFTTLTSNYLEVIFTNEQKKYETTKFYYKGTICIRSSNRDVYNMRGIKVN